MRCLLRRRLRSPRELLVVALLFVLLVFYAPSLVRVPAAPSPDIRRPDFNAVVDSFDSVQTVPLTSVLEKLTSVVLTGNARAPAPDVDAACDQSGGAPERPSEDVGEAFRWQKVVPNSDDVYVFSAHHDARWNPTPLVVVIGLSTEYLTGATDRFCRLWYVGDPRPHTTLAETRFVGETHGRRYAVSYYTCHVRATDSVPYAVTLLNDRCARSTDNLLAVQRAPPAGSTSAVNFTVCVTPFNFHYNNHHQLVEMIEVSRMFGAQRFVFYNHSTGPNVELYLDVYRRLGIVDVVQWPLPVAVEVWPPPPDGYKVDPEVHYFAQLAALNDCLYRALLRPSTFVVYEDLDELFVPRRRLDWASTLSDASGGGGDGGGGDFPGAYMIRNTFFRTDWPSDRGVDKSAADFQVLSLTKTQRESKIYDWHSRSKFVVWAKAAVVVGVHQPLELLPGASTIYVDQDAALLHHYRLWMDDPNSRIQIVVDRHLHQYADEILRRVVKRHRDVDRWIQERARLGWV